MTVAHKRYEASLSMANVNMFWEKMTVETKKKSDCRYLGAGGTKEVL